MGPRTPALTSCYGWAGTACVCARAFVDVQVSEENLALQAMELYGSTRQRVAPSSSQRAAVGQSMSGTGGAATGAIGADGAGGALGGRSGGQLGIGDSSSGGGAVIAGLPRSRVPSSATLLQPALSHVTSGVLIADLVQDVGLSVSQQGTPSPCSSMRALSPLPPRAPAAAADT